MRWCLYLVGDKNIIVPSLVFLKSVKEYNDIDLVLITETKEIPQDINNYIRENSIKLYDFSDIPEISKIENQVSSMDRWPKHVFYNYYVLSFLERKGYDYAIKADYDMLCISRYDLEAIKPAKNEICCAFLKDFLTRFLEKEGIKLITDSFGDFLNYKSINAGFIVFDLAEAKKRNFEINFTDFYNFVIGNKIKITNNETIEQFCLGLLQLRFQHSFKQLKEDYNFRPLFSPKWECIKNIHYNSHFKPWKKLDINKIRDQQVRFNGLFSFYKVFIFYNSWLSKCSELPIKKYLERSECYSNVEQLQMFNLISRITNEVESSKRTLEICASRINEIMRDNLEMKKNPNLEWIQFPISSDGALHYELTTTRSNQIRGSIHFEKKWINYKKSVEVSQILQLCPIPLLEGKNGYYFEVMPSKDFHNIIYSMVLLMKTTCGSLKTMANLK